MKVAGNVKIADAGDIKVATAGKVDVSGIIVVGICFGVGFSIRFGICLIVGFGVGFDFGIVWIHSLFGVDWPYDGAAGFDFVDFGNHNGLAVV